MLTEIVCGHFYRNNGMFFISLFSVEKYVVSCYKVSLCSIYTLCLLYYSCNRQVGGSTGKVQER